MAKIYVCPDGATCVRFDDNTGWWTYAEGRSSQLIRPWRWHRVDDQVVADAVVEEIREDVARRYAKIGGPWVPRVHAAETQAQIEDAWRSRLGEYPETAHEALQVISDITGTCPAEATTMVVADVFALSRVLVRKLGVTYEDDDWDLVSALQTAIDRVDPYGPDAMCPDSTITGSELLAKLREESEEMTEDERASFAAALRQMGARD